MIEILLALILGFSSTVSSNSHMNGFSPANDSKQQGGGGGGDGCVGPDGKPDPTAVVEDHVLEKITVSVIAPADPASRQRLAFSGRLAPTSVTLDGFDGSGRDQRTVTSPIFGRRSFPLGSTLNRALAVNRMANYFLKTLFAIRLNDTTNAFKAYRREVIEGCRPLISPHFNLTVELPLKAIVRGFSFAVIPITWRNRRTGAPAGEI